MITGKLTELMAQERICDLYTAAEARRTPQVEPRSPRGLTRTLARFRASRR